MRRRLRWNARSALAHLAASELALATALSAGGIAGCGRIGFNALDPLTDDGPLASDGGAGGSASDGGLDASIGGGSGTGGVVGGGGSSSGGGSGTGGTAEDGGNGATGGLSGSGGTTSSGGTASTGGAAGSGGQDGGTVTQIIDVTDPNQFVLSGTAEISGGALLVIPDVRDSSGAAYLPGSYALTPTTSFVISFSFRITAQGPSADGFAFVWQNDPRGTASLGPGGAALGYGGIVPSVAVEFDTMPNPPESVDHVAIATNGAYLTPLAQSAPAVALDSGATQYAWIEYDAPTTTLSVYHASAPQRPVSPLVSASVDFYAILGASAYLGFTSGSGTASEENAILSLTVEYTP
jgi:hypothetical protein